MQADLDSRLALPLERELAGSAAGRAALRLDVARDRACGKGGWRGNVRMRGATGLAAAARQVGEDRCARGGQNCANGTR